MDPLLTSLRGLLPAWLTGRRDGDQRPTAVPEVTVALESADLLLAEDHTAEAQPLLDAVAPALGRMRGPDGARLRAVHQLLLAEFAQHRGALDVAQTWVEKARASIAGVTDAALAGSLAARADALALLCSTLESVTPERLEAGARALESEAAREAPETLLRLVWAAHWMGQIHHRRGDWGRARPALETAIALADRLAHPADAAGAWDAAARARFVVGGAVAAASAALELAGVARGLGRDDEARAWFARAVEVLGPARLPQAHFARAQAYLMRALHEPLDELQAPAIRVAYLETAAEEARASGEPRGFALAHQAENMLAGLHTSMGSPERALPHLMRALEAALRSGEPGAALVAGSHYSLGLHHEGRGNGPSARAAFATTWDLGRAHPEPEVRRLAAMAGARLHAQLLDAGEAAEAAVLLDAVDELVPTLAEGARGLLAAVVTDARGVAALRADRFEEAAACFAEAIRLAQGAAGDEGADASRGMLVRHAVALWRLERSAEAERRLGEALALPERPGSGAADRAARADIRLQRANLRAALDRGREAEDDLRGAFDLGRDSGTAQGRRTAAMAALALGDVHRDEPDVRRRHYETAIHLGRLSGLPEGLEVARAAELRLREPAD